LTPAELDTFYRGTGSATIVVDFAGDIIACNYAGRENDQPAFLTALRSRARDGWKASCPASSARAALTSRPTRAATFYPCAGKKLSVTGRSGKRTSSFATGSGSAGQSSASDRSPGSGIA
jgi:hypothetical protein